MFYRIVLIYSIENLVYTQISNVAVQLPSDEIGKCELLAQNEKPPDVLLVVITLNRPVPPESC